jgi:hypothetical protein
MSISATVSGTAVAVACRQQHADLRVEAAAVQQRSQRIVLGRFRQRLRLLRERLLVLRKELGLLAELRRLTRDLLEIEPKVRGARRVLARRRELASRTAWKRLNAASDSLTLPSRSHCAESSEQASASRLFASLDSASAIASLK